MTSSKRKPDKCSPEVSEGPIYRLIDLFCGAGGLTRGFYPPFTKGFQVVWANDDDSSAAESYNVNFGAASAQHWLQDYQYRLDAVADHCIPGDIIDLLRRPSTVIRQYGEDLAFTQFEYLWNTR